MLQQALLDCWQYRLYQQHQRQAVLLGIMSVPAAAAAAQQQQQQLWLLVVTQGTLIRMLSQKLLWLQQLLPLPADPWPSTGPHSSSSSRKSRCSSSCTLL
jgi:hypothetical protein